MAKKNTWHCLWGPIKVLNNEAEVQISHFPVKRLDDLKLCTSIYKLGFYHSQDKLDLEKISHISGLRTLEIEKCKIYNEQTLMSLPNLCEVEVDTNSLTESQRAFFKKLNDEILTQNRSRIEQLNEDIFINMFGPEWKKRLTDEERKAQEKDILALKQAILSMEWNKVFSSGATHTLDRALQGLFGWHIKEEKCKDIIEGLLSCTDEDVFSLIVKSGLLARKRNVSEHFFSILPKYTDRLAPVLKDCFLYYMQLPTLGTCDAAFSTGKLKEGHFAIIHFLKQVAAPQFTGIFKLFLEDRQHFSDQHLIAYKRLLEVIHKCQSTDLAEPVIDLIQYERYIPGGDAAFVKKCLKAASKLGDKHHLDSLAQALHSESRDDVLKEYELSKKRLSKKK